MTTSRIPLVSTEGYAVGNLGRNVGQPCRYPTILMSEIEFAEDPTFVPGIVDPGDLASGRQSEVR